MELINNILELMLESGIWKFHLLAVGLFFASLTNFILYRKYKKKWDLGTSIITMILFLFTTFLLLLSYIS
jgi:uncharacterized membrane protein